MFHSILVLLDGSPFGEHSIPMAVAISKATGASVTLAHVHEFPLNDYPVPAVLSRMEKLIKRQDNEYLKDIAQRVRDKTHISSRTLLLEGDVCQAVSNAADGVEFDLIVMATHGRGALGRFWFGSVADKLVRHLTKPILFVKPQEGPPDFGSVSAIKNVLLPLDGSHLAEQIIEPALQLGPNSNIELTLFRAIRPVIRPTYMAEGMSLGVNLDGVLDEIEALQQRECGAAQRYLDEMAKKLRDRQIRVQTRICVEEDAARSILHDAKNHSSQIIAIATHGRQGMQRFFLGSVASKLVRAGNFPVLVYRPKSPSDD